VGCQFLDFAAKKTILARVGWWQWQMPKLFLYFYFFSSVNSIHLPHLPHLPLKMKKNTDFANFVFYLYLDYNFMENS
jgi:hypothetical protein